MLETGMYTDDLVQGQEFKVSNQSQPSPGYNYIVSAHKPTAVYACATGQLTSTNDLNLVIARNNVLELHLVTPEGLKLLKEISIYGKITCLELFTPRSVSPLGDKPKDLIFLLTDRHNVMILECLCNDDQLDIITRAHGNVADTNGKECESGMQAVIDPEARCIVLRLYEGLVKVIPLEESNTELLAFNLRVDELQVCDIQFLHGCSSPTLIKLHQDGNGRHIRTHTLSLREKEFSKVPWKLDNVEAEAVMIIPVPEPLCGAIVVGQETISYIKPDSHVTIAAGILSTSTVICYAPVDRDGSRYLLGDLSGRLFMLLLEKTAPDADPDIKLELLGEVCTPECITYLDNGVIYVGSRLGDSRLVRLNKTQDPVTKSFLTTMQTFPNLGPIAHMTVVDLERQGQGQLITCSGAFKEGSLRIIRNGVGIQELACIELPKIRGMWGLSIAASDASIHNTLVVTFHSSTRFLKVGGDIVDEIRIPGFLNKKMTFYAANVNFHQVIQVTRCGVRLVKEDTCKLVQHWCPPDDRPVSLATSNPGQVVVTSGPYVYYLTVADGALNLVSQCQLEHEVACVDVSPLGGADEASVVGVGMWTDITTRILALPSLNEVYKEPLGGDIIPRSMLLATFEDVHYLLVAVGDGQLVYYVYNPKQRHLTDRKRVVVGMLPTQLRRFNSGSVSNVFACSDRPTVIYSSNHKLVFSKVNLKEVTHMCPLNSEAYPNSLALANGEGVTIGTIDEIQKLHIRTVPLGETPRYIAYQEETETFGVVTFRVDVCEDPNINTGSTAVVGSTPAPARGPSGAVSGANVPGYGIQYGLGLDGATPASLTAHNTSYALTTTSIIKTGIVPPPERGQEIETYNLLIMAQNTFEVIHCHAFCPHEYVISLISTKLRDDPVPYYICGTAIVNPEESEAKVGRIVIFSFTDSKLVQVAEKEMKGAITVLQEFQGKLLAAVNNTVRLFEWTQEKELQLECSHFNNIYAVAMKKKGDFVLIGDLMRSMALLQYKTLEGNFEEIARDYEPNWLTCIEILDDEFFLAAEHLNNIFVCHKDSGASTEEERQQMVDVARYHLGDFVNVFCPGSLVMRGEEAGPLGVAQSGVLFGTVSGCIGLSISISGDLYNFLTELSSRLSKVIKSVGKINHSFYRSFHSDKRVKKMQGFIDGDLVENFMDLSKDKMEEVCSKLTMNVNGQAVEMNVNEVMKLVEELSRLH
ncbi:DNA damage-binding protein 1 [Hyalella azteca]|uniref:DNA damage-binding protein 1 n=1 Tax=Hyalella azteca TaxID=294128 RepID=A0A8B7NWC4_HYAAZ|nr:DNA damage-binding protein 1 [Hyalella azteca]